MTCNSNKQGLSWIVRNKRHFALWVLLYAILPTINNCMLNSIQLFIRRSRDISLRSPSTALQVLPLVTSMSQGKTIPALARSFRTLNKNSYPLLLN